MTGKGLFSNGVATMAIAALMATLGGAAASADPFCERYAAQAVEHNAQARANNCGFSGKNWNSNTGGHYQFCVQVGQREAQTYERGRAQAIETCASKNKGAPGKNENGACQSYARKYTAIYREAARLCKNVPYRLGDPLRACLSWPASKRARNMDQAIGKILEVKATCKRR